MVPILLLTGFLGSGKTTLLNRLLDERPLSGPFAESSGKLALIVNEFGDVGIDGDLLPDEMTRQIEIKGGCICCRLDGDLENTLSELLDTQPNLSAIIIETTGIAEPLPISWTLANESLSSRLRLAAVMTVVDALEHDKHRPLSPSVDAQVEYADLLLITKLDLCDESRRSELETSLRERNEVAPIMAGNTEGLVGRLWVALDDPSLERQAPLQSSPPPASTHGFASISLEIKNTIDFEVLIESLEELPPTYIRIKGIARVIDASSGQTTPHMIAFHRVGARVSAEPARDDLDTRIVAIGTDLDAAELSACVASAVVD
jgi:G3E family GTPase